MAVLMASIDNVEPIIHDGNYHLYATDPVIDGEQKKRGLVPRNYSTHPRGFYPSLSAVDFPLIPEGDYSQRLKDQIADGRCLSMVKRAKHVPIQDQNGKGYCLPPGTPVAMADGSHKAIEDVRLGDTVLTNQLRPRRVGRLYQRLYTGDMVSLRAEGMERSVIMTADHLIPNPSGDPRWPDAFHDSPAGAFSPGATVYVRGDGELAQRKVTWVGRKPVRDVPVFDIGVEEDHYFLAGDGLLVHNCWAHSTCGAVMTFRAVMNEPTVSLSAYSVACVIKHFQDQGGWGAESADYVSQHGFVPESHWPLRSMSQSNNNPAAWAEAAKYRISGQWADLQAAQYDRNLSWAQYVTCWLAGFPTICDFNWWGHSVEGCDLVEGASLRNRCRAESGKILTVEEFDAIWMSDPVTAGFGSRIANSWSTTWGDGGYGVLAGSKARPDGGLALRGVLAA